MSVAKKLATIAPAILLATAACTTGFPTQVARFQAMPAPDGQTFFVQPANPRDQGGLEFSQYAALVRAHLLAQGYHEASVAQQASLVVTLDYGVDNGREKIVSYPSYGYGYGWGYPYGYWGRHSAFYYGWNDPWFGGPWGYNDIHSYTVFTSFLSMDIRRTADNQSVFEGTAKARSTSDELPYLVPNLVEAMFTNFPGQSGETVKITVPPPQKTAQRY